MHKNPTVTVRSIVDRIKKNGLSVSREQFFALIFMQYKEFIKVQQSIENQTRVQIKASFNQYLIDQLLVLDEKTREKVEELSASGELENELNEDKLPWDDEYSPFDDTDHAQRNSVLPFIHPYRSDKKDILAISPDPNKKTKSPTLTNASNHFTDPNPSLEQSSANLDTLTDEQVNQLIKTGTLQSIRAVLRDDTIILTEGQNIQLREQLMVLSPAPQLPDRINTIEIREGNNKVRLNQAAFRARVLSEYGYQCAITGIAITAILEAAHVIPANGSNDHVDNSLLLSKNMHGLFDRFLISINSDTNQLELAPSIRGKGLDEYQGKVIKHSISNESLEWHYSNFKAGIIDLNH